MVNVRGIRSQCVCIGLYNIIYLCVCVCVCVYACVVTDEETKMLGWSV